MRSWYVHCVAPRGVHLIPHVMQSEEDLQLKNELEMLIERLRVSDSLHVEVDACAY